MPFAVEPSTEISNRYDLAKLCNARGYKDAVEIGVDHAVFSRQFLSNFKGHWLILVDPYEPFPEMAYDRAPDMLAAAQALRPFHGRFRFVRERSEAAARFVRSFVTPDFVYIDGAHDYENVKKDIEIWWKELTLNGMLAGHDYDKAHPDVIRAVTEFASDNNLVVRLTQETDFPPSWYIYRTEPKYLIYQYWRTGRDLNQHYRGSA